MVLFCSACIQHYIGMLLDNWYLLDQATLLRTAQLCKRLGGVQQDKYAKVECVLFAYLFPAVRA